MDFIRPETFGAQAYDVLPANPVDSGPGLRKAFKQLTPDGNRFQNVRLSPGRYYVAEGNIEFTAEEVTSMAGQVILGAGIGIDERTTTNIPTQRGGTLIQFADPSITSLVRADTTDEYITGWEFGNMTLVGVGKDAETLCDGFFIDTNASGMKGCYRSKIHDLFVVDVSRDGFRAINYWDNTTERVSAAHCGRHGIVVAGDGAFTDCGQFNFDIGGRSMWIVSGFPVINNFVTGDCAVGMKFGVDPSEYTEIPGCGSQGRGCWPMLQRINIEPCSEAGLEFSRYSNLSYGHGVSFTAKTGYTPKGIVWTHPSKSGQMIHPNFNGTFSTRFEMNNDAVIGNPAHVLLQCGYNEYDPSKTSGSFKPALCALKHYGSYGWLGSADPSSWFLGGTVKLGSDVPASPQHGNMWIISSGKSGVAIAHGNGLFGQFFWGSGSPEGVCTAAPGAAYFNKLGGAGTTMWAKENGNGNTGWVAK